MSVGMVASASATRGAGARVAVAVVVIFAVTLLPWVAAAETTLELFTRPGCPHCVEARRFLDALKKERADFTVVEHDITREAGALTRLRELTARAGIATPGVPTFVVGAAVVVGFDPATTPDKLRALLDQSRRSSAERDVCSLDPSQCKASGPEAKSDTIELPLVGEVELRSVGLPLFTLAIGLVDGFNPCATWVLLFLLAMLVHLKSRARMALIAGTFVVVSGVVYFAFMAAWLTFFVVVGMSQLLRLVLAALALAIGTLNVKDFFALKHGPSLSISESAKPELYGRVRDILQAKNLAGAMVGIVVLAFVVNLVELLCTAGLPALYTAILTDQGLRTWEYYAYLSLYIVAYMLDDAVLATIAVVTLSRRKLQEREGRWLKLMSGLIVLSLGAVLLARPEWLGV